MTRLSSIPEISPSSLELLEAAGFLDAESLAKAGTEELIHELERANSILQLAKRPPTREHIESWIVTAREMTGTEMEPEQAVATAVAVAQATVAGPVAMPVNYELNEEVMEMLDRAPFAIPLPARILVEQHLPVSGIPPAILLNRYSGDLEVRVADAAPASPPSRPQVAANFSQVSENVPSKLEIDTARVRAIASSPEMKERVTAPRGIPETDRVALIRAPLEQTNRGKDPRSRTYIRGVLHGRPFLIYFGAVFTMILVFLLPVSIVSAVLLLFSDLLPDRFDWVPKWILAFPLALPVMGLAYLMFGVNSTCRICGQRLFVPRACRKNAKAHHLPLLGYIIPLCLHVILFRWFRCTYCGTPVRVKK